MVLEKLLPEVFSLNGQRVSYGMRLILQFSNAWDSTSWIKETKRKVLPQENILINITMAIATNFSLFNLNVFLSWKKKYFGYLYSIRTDRVFIVIIEYQNVQKERQSMSHYLVRHTTVLSNG